MPLFPWGAHWNVSLWLFDHAKCIVAHLVHRFHRCPNLNVSPVRVLSKANLRSLSGCTHLWSTADEWFSLGFFMKSSGWGGLPPHLVPLAGSVGRSGALSFDSWPSSSTDWQPTLMNSEMVLWKTSLGLPLVNFHTALMFEQSTTVDAPSWPPPSSVCLGVFCLFSAPISSSPIACHLSGLSSILSWKSVGLPHRQKAFSHGHNELSEINIKNAMLQTANTLAIWIWCTFLDETMLLVDPSASSAGILGCPAFCPLAWCAVALNISNSDKIYRLSKHNV